MLMANVGDQTSICSRWQPPNRGGLPSRYRTCGLIILLMLVHGDGVLDIGGGYTRVLVPNARVSYRQPSTALYGDGAIGRGNFEPVLDAVDVELKSAGLGCVECMQVL